MKSLKNSSVILYLDKGIPNREESLNLCINLLRLNGFVLIDPESTYILHKSDVFLMRSSGLLKPYHYLKETE